MAHVLDNDLKEWKAYLISFLTEIDFFILGKLPSDD